MASRGSENGSAWEKVVIWYRREGTAVAAYEEAVTTGTDVLVNALACDGWEDEAPHERAGLSFVRKETGRDAGVVERLMLAPSE